MMIKSWAPQLAGPQGMAAPMAVPPIGGGLPARQHNLKIPPHAPMTRVAGEPDDGPVTHQRYRRSDERSQRVGSRGKDSMGIFNGLFAKSETNYQTYEMADAMLKITLMHDYAMNRGCDADEIPEGVGRFGLDVTNPVPVHGFPECDRYLNRLRYRGEPVTWFRVGAFRAENLAMPVDIYEIYDASSRPVGRIHISPYHRRTSGLAPEGFTLVGE